MSECSHEEEVVFKAVDEKARFVSCSICFAVIVHGPEAQAHYDWHVALGKKVSQAGSPLGLGFLEGRGPL